MEEVKTAGSFQQEMLRSAARAARGGACLWSGGWIDFPAEIHSSPELAELLTGGRTLRSDNGTWSGEGLLSPEASGAEAHSLGFGSMSELKLRPPDFTVC